VGVVAEGVFEASKAARSSGGNVPLGVDAVFVPMTFVVEVLGG